MQWVENEVEGYGNILPDCISLDWNHFHGFYFFASAKHGFQTNTMFLTGARAQTYTHMLNIIRQEPEDFLHLTNVLPACQMAPVCTENRFLPLFLRLQNKNNHRPSINSPNYQADLIELWIPLERSIFPLIILFRFHPPVDEQRLLAIFWSRCQITSDVPGSGRSLTDAVTFHSAAAVVSQTTNIVHATYLMCLYLNAETFGIMAWIG